MANRKTTSVDALYTEGRHFPRGQNRDPQSRQRIECEPSMESKGPALRDNANQDPEDFHDRGYDNEVADDWRRGGGENATGKPGYDKGSSWRLKDKGNDWHSGSDPAVIRKPEPNKP